MTIYHHRSRRISGRSILIGLFLLMELTGKMGWAEDKKIVLATCNWEPFFGETLVNGGYVIEITKEAFLRAGYELEVKFVPWKRALETAKAGKADGVIGTNYSDERARTYRLTDVVYQEENGFFRKKGRAITYKTLRDLTPYKIGYMRGGSFGAEFDTAAYLKKQDVTDNELNIKKLIGGRIDLFISARLIVIHLLRTKYPEWQEEIEFIVPPYLMINVHHAISRAISNSEKIVADFNQGLKEIRDDGTYQKILEKHGFATP